MSYITIRKSLLFLIVMALCSNFFSDDLVAVEDSSKNAAQLQLFNYNSAQKHYEFVDKDNNPSNSFSLSNPLQKRVYTHDGRDWITLVTLVKTPDGYFLQETKYCYFTVEEHDKIILKSKVPDHITKIFDGLQKTNLTEKQALLIEDVLKKQVETKPIAIDQYRRLYQFCKYIDTTKVAKAEKKSGESIIKGKEEKNIIIQYPFFLPLLVAGILIICLKFNR